MKENKDVKDVYRVVSANSPIGVTPCDVAERVYLSANRVDALLESLLRRGLIRKTYAPKQKEDVYIMNRRAARDLVRGLLEEDED